MLCVSDVYVLINYYGQILWLSTAACTCGLLWLRYKRPDIPRPIKVNIAIPILFLLCCLFIILFPIPKQPWNTVIGLAITLSGKFSLSISKLIWKESLNTCKNIVRLLILIVSNFKSINYIISVIHIVSTFRGGSSKD